VRAMSSQKLISTLVSDPYHSRYGQHLSHDEVNALIAPKDEALDLVHEWLRSNGVDKFDYSPSKDWINIRVTVEEAEKLLGAEYSVYAHDDGTELARTTKWSLPSHLHEHIDTVQPTTSFMRTKVSSDFADPKPLNLSETYMPPGYVPPTDPVLAKACSINGTTPTCCKLIITLPSNFSSIVIIFSLACVTQHLQILLKSVLTNLL
jgi:tripeptidyl-peptidase-1